MDSALAQWLNDRAVHHATVGDAAQWSAQNLAVVLVATLALGWALAVLRAYRATGRLPWRLIEVGLCAVVALGVGLGFNQVIGHLWFRSRPYAALATIHPLLPPSPDPSFPSDHAAAAMALTAVALPFLPRLGVLLLGEALLLMAGRVAVGLHYPSDMLGGLLIGLMAAATAVLLVRLLRRWLTRVAALVPFPVRVENAAALPIGPARKLQAAGLLAALVGLPTLVEALADPVRARSAWVEDLLQVLIVVGLATLCAALLWGGQRVEHRFER
jgi:membrane-associated phospholipid phosphatase